MSGETAAAQFETGGLYGFLLFTTAIYRKDRAMLREVIIRSNYTDKQCEEAINRAIEEHPNNEISFTMIIETTISAFNEDQKTLYTLMIRIEDIE